jgi:hypothetical protein
MKDISTITETVFRLRATFTRLIPTGSPVIDKWSVSWFRYSDINQPSTNITFYPDFPDGKEGWYISSVNIFMNAFDSDSPPENITTFFNINNNGFEIYSADNPPILSSDGFDNKIEYWSKDNAENEENPHKIIQGLKIDKNAPFIDIKKPADLVEPGNITVNGTVPEYASGSGLDRLIIKVNGEEFFNSSISGLLKFFDLNFNAELGKTYDIHVIAFDKAGNKGQGRRQIIVSEKGVYEPGYLYLFDNPKSGPRPVLKKLNLALVFSYNNLFVKYPCFNQNASSAKFLATKLQKNEEFIIWDNNLSDSCSCDLKIPSGLYEIKVFIYDKDNNEIGCDVLISKLFIWFLSS